MTYDDYMRMGNPWAVLRAAPIHEPARDAAVARIVDTMLELQLDRRHISPGWPAMSITALAGEAPGGGGMHDQMLIASQKYSPDSDWHRACASMMKMVPARQMVAMLMQGARVRPGHSGSAFSVTAKQMVERQGVLMQMLGMKGAAQFESVEALQKCGRRGRSKLRELVGAQQITQEAG